MGLVEGGVGGKVTWLLTIFSFREERAASFSAGKRAYRSVATSKSSTASPSHSNRSNYERLMHTRHHVTSAPLPPFPLLISLPSFPTSALAQDHQPCNLPSIHPSTAASTHLCNQPTDNPTDHLSNNSSNYLTPPHSCLHPSTSPIRPI